MKQRKLLHWILPLAFTLFFIAGRVFLYGPMNDSVAAHDTDSYFEAAAADFPSISFFEQMRSATLPLIIKLLNPEQKYELTVLSEPFFGSEPELAVQPGTESLVRFQTLLSIFSWVFFTLSLCSQLRRVSSKALLAGLLYSFAAVPQIADWDSILLSESISFSLFVLMLGLLIHLLPLFFGRDPGRQEILLGVLFVFVTACWLFTRDTNAYFILLLAVVFSAGSVYRWLKTRKAPLLTLALSILLAGFFIFQQQTFQKSERWLLPFLNNMAANVFPYSERVAFFEARGMPVSEVLLAQAGSAEYNELYQQEDFIRWAKADGLSAYSAFLLDMPLWAVLQVYNNLDAFFKENIQPFFYGKPEEKPLWANSLGNLLHPLSAAVILIDLLLILLLGQQVFRNAGMNAGIWLLFCLILFIGSGLLLSISYLGEVRSIWRHVLSGVFPLRMLLWILVPVLWDQASGTSSGTSTPDQG